MLRFPKPGVKIPKKKSICKLAKNKFTKKRENKRKGEFSGLEASGVSPNPLPGQNQKTTMAKKKGVGKGRNGGGLKRAFDTGVVLFSLGW